MSLPPHLTPADLDRYAAQVFATGSETARSTAPFTGEPLPPVPQSSAADVALAATRARSAQVAWAARSVAERAAIALAFGELLVAERDKLVDLVQWETGKSRIHAGIEALGVASVAAHYGAESAGYLAPVSVRSGVPGVVRARVTRHPKGLVGVIAPWNYPLFLAVGDVIPALVAGNTVLSKADSQAPLTLLAARELAVRAGVPADVWQVVAGPGSALGQAIIDQVDHLAFTGSTATGRRLAAAAGERLISTSLELGGKNPMIVRQDANLEAAVTGAVQACFASAGQMCIGIERIYVHESRYPEFVERLVAQTRALTMGASYEHDVELGTLTSAEQLAATVGHVEDAVAQGATVAVGGVARPDLGPFFFEPTVLTGVLPTMKVFTEETFGPVVAVYPVVDDEDAVTRANDSEYGLSASVWSKDLGAAQELAQRIQAGAVNINDGYLSAISSLSAPMGGMKTSGVGRRHAADGILRFTESQTTTSQRVATPYPSRTKRHRGAYLATTRLVMLAQLKAAKLKVSRTARKDT
ncbi:succinate-semialdehyde dehydrogenase (NADP(+)) [Nocardioides marmoriginsengisoli]|uniref:Succinate-semialdehyde dehydrogenase (NADP(+)) n=1 Tax=Nocardioides marmoriginsengisoli TaxID=661483 RepID=A0A3N0CDM4_9ACTN|nr:succinic semialdehyde dehydrogenase [Nocardioides marmoriginsengisoli]RNL61103.1 succinate-semialdehyde dehydrogenase (NADP(+)) [Nocardioides marmoriginsengisoli]